MTDYVIRFLVGGVVVSFFAMLGDVLNPKSFAGLFSAAPSVALATIALAHPNDHYGQMVEYLRQNGIVPPASQGQPPANPSRK